jgi:uncharacterized protein (UPF0254 family)
MPFHPVVDTLRQACAIQEGDTAETVAAKLEQRVRRLDERLVPTLPFLRSMLGVDPGDRTVSTMDPKLRRVEIVHATQQMLSRAAEVHPHVMVL